jgi:hypothetical protein
VPLIRHKQMVWYALSLYAILTLLNFVIRHKQMVWYALSLSICIYTYIVQRELSQKSTVDTDHHGFHAPCALPADGLIQPSSRYNRQMFHVFLEGVPKTPPWRRPCYNGPQVGVYGPRIWWLETRHKKKKLSKVSALR